MEFVKNNLQSLIPLITDYGVKILGALLLLVLSTWLGKKCRQLSMAAMRRARIDETLVKFGGTFIKWAVITVAAVSVLSIFGIQTASFAAVLAAMGLAIGLAFQGTLSNLAAGTMLLVFRPFRVGHFIKVSGEAGTVDEVGIFTTTLNTPDMRRIILPNASVFGATIENVSHHPTRRVDVSVGTAYNANLEQTKSVLLMAVKSRVEGVLTDPEPEVVLTGLGASSVDWAIRAFAKTEDYWKVRERLLYATKSALDEAKIGIPFPQMDVHIQHSDDEGNGVFSSIRKALTSDQDASRA